jgi:hypothetical protein
LFLIKAERRLLCVIIGMDSLSVGHASHYLDKLSHDIRLS